MSLDSIREVITKEGEVIVLYCLRVIKATGIDQIHIQSHIQTFPKIGGKPGFKPLLQVLSGPGTLIVEPRIRYARVDEQQFLRIF